MDQLDRIDVIRKVDRENMLELIRTFSDQLHHAHEIGRSLSLDPALGEGISNVVFSGMGGSAIGADFIRAYLNYELPIPIFVNRHYRLPAFVDDKTLLIASSYSGNTEETIASLEEGRRHKARLLAIASGGQLARLASRHRFPLIEIPQKFPPRAALGYSVFPLLIALSKIGFPTVYREEAFLEVEQLIRSLAETQYDVGVSRATNLAKQMAMSCFKKYTIIYAGTDHFDVVALRWRGQIEENAKALASHHVLPEMNHNELVGWKFPNAILKDTVVIMLRDQEDHDRVQIRMDLTRDVVRSLAAKVIEVYSQGESLLARMFSLIHLGDWMSFYLAILNGVDPIPVEVVNYLKTELARADVT